jgi:hypothetical protein
MARIIYQGTPASLPYTFNYTPDSNEPVILMMQGSCWAATGSTMIGLELSIGGTTEIISAIYANPSTTHMATITKLQEYKFPLEVHNGVVTPVQITISKLNANTNFDVNDSVTIAIMGKSE